MRMASEGVKRPVKHDPSSLVDDINSLNIFGKCKREDLEFRDDEEKERERKINEEIRMKEKEIRKQEQKRKEEEEAFERFKRELMRKEATKSFKTYNNPPRGVGRARSLMEDFPRPIEKKPGNHVSSQDIGCLPFFERAERVRDNIDQFCGDSGLHSTSAQKEFWRPKNGEDIEDEEIDYDFPVNDSPVSDQYEDAESSAASLSYVSAPSDASRDSPAVFAPSPSLDLPPRTSGAVSSPRKPRGNRIAARFTNSFENNEDSEKDEEKEDPFAILGSSRPPAVAVKYTASRRLATGTSFNSIRPSQRVLSNDFFFNTSASPVEDFCYKADDFPPL